MTALSSKCLCFQIHHEVDDAEGTVFAGWQAAVSKVVMESWTFLWGCNTNTPMNCHVQLCGPLPTHSLHRCSCLLVCNALCHHMSQGFHIMGLLCHITGSATLQVCCVTSQGVSRHRFVVLHHRVCHRVCHATVFWCHITGSVTGSVMPQVCCVTSQGLSRHRFVVSHHRVCHTTGLLCYITEYAERQDGSMLLK